jgi:hypothetical protein
MSQLKRGEKSDEGGNGKARREREGEGGREGGSEGTQQAVNRHFFTVFRHK